MGATPFQALLGQLEMLNDDRAFSPTTRGNMDMMFTQDGSIDAADVWANALPWDSASTAYTQTTTTEATSPNDTADDSFHHGHNDHYYNHSNRPSIIYEEKCDSPECQVQECHEPECAEDLVECTDPYCLPEDICPEPDACHSGTTKCAGSLEMDIVSAAASLAAMKPPAMSSGQFYNGAQNYDFCAALANGYTNATHPPHFGACMFTNAYIPSYNNNGMNGASTQDNGMCQYINNSSNFCQSHETYHNMGPPSFQNSTLQYAMSLRDLSSRSSSSQDPFTFSTEPTPSSASTYSSPHPPSADNVLLTPASQPDPNFPVPLCQWHDSPNSAPCNQTFPTKAALQSHIQSVHTAPLSKSLGFVCRWSGCSRLSLPTDRAGFAQRSKLDRHMQSHTGHKACKCPECHHEFSTSQTLESHMRTHTGDKPFKCKEPGCDYEAAQASQLTMHTRTKHTREKPLLCDFPGCGRRFAESSNLSKHKKIHEPEEECRCGVCGKSFRRRDQLRRHLKIHVRKDGLSERGARKALGGVLKGGDEISETGSQLLSPSPSVPPGTGTSTEVDFHENERQMAMTMDMEVDGTQMMSSQHLTAQTNWAMA